VYLGDKKLGQTPLNVEVPPGKRVRVRLRAARYQPQVVELDGTKSTVSIKLVRRPEERIGPLPIDL
jgi:hypothetical protein